MGTVKTSLAAGTDILGKVYITDGTEDVNVNASNQLEVSVENAVVVSATDLDIRNLTAATDAVKIGDGTETANVTASNELNVLETNSADIETAVQSSATTVYLEDSGHTTADPGIQMLAVRNDTASALCDTDLDYAPLITDSTGRLHVTLADTITVSATDLDIRNLAPATDEVKIGDGTDTLNITGDGRAETVVMGLTPDGTNGMPSLDDPARRGYVAVTDGTTSLAVAVNTAAAKTAGVQMMAMYDATVPAAATDGYAVTPLADAYGVLQTTGHVGNAFRAAQNVAEAQTNTELVATPGAGLSLYITDVIISNGATAGNVKLVESTASSPLDIIEVAYLAINGGFVANFQTPLKLTANKNLGYTSVSCTTHSVTVAGYIAP